MSDDPALALLADELVAPTASSPSTASSTPSATHARDPRRADRFLIPRSLAPRWSHDDLMTLDLDGNPVDQDTRRPFLERFLHGAIYRRRPDVQAVVHSHAHR
jgi:ribulose-5-phosphate 4-epimerase/fuculose-1-phosphate aldolase